MSKYCPKCGNQLNDNDMYCNVCGHNQASNLEIVNKKNIDSSSDGSILALLIISDILAFISLFMINEDGLHFILYFPAIILWIIGLCIASKKGYKVPIRDLKGANKAFTIIGLVLNILGIIIYFCISMGSIY